MNQKLGRYFCRYARSWGLQGSEPPHPSSGKYCHFRAKFWQKRSVIAQKSSFLWTSLCKIHGSALGAFYFQNYGVGVKQTKGVFLIFQFFLIFIIGETLASTELCNKQDVIAPYPLPKLKKEDSLMQQDFSTTLYNCWEGSTNFAEFRFRFGDALNHKYFSCKFDYLLSWVSNLQSSIILLVFVETCVIMFVLYV